jgi:hypothetical protein
MEHNITINFKATISIKVFVMCGFALATIIIWNSNLYGYIFLAQIYLSAYYYGVVITFPNAPNLVAQPEFFHRYLRVHLRKRDTAFTKEVYKDLETIIHLMPKHNIEALILTSPLLAKDRKFRSTHRLERLPVTIEKHHVPVWRNPVETVTLAFYKYMLKSAFLRNADLTRQYRLIIRPITLSESEAYAK